MYRFWRFGLKLFIHAPFWGVFEAYFPHMTSSIVVTPKRTFLGRKHVVWAIRAIQRKNQCDGSTWTRDREKIQDNKKVTKVLYFFYLGEAPTGPWWVISTTWSRVLSFQLKSSWVTILQGVEFSIFLLIFAWALQEWSAIALPVNWLQQAHSYWNIVIVSVTKTTRHHTIL